MNEQELIALDKELAEALGWTGVHLYPNDFAPNAKLVGDIPNSSAEAVITRWTQDDGTVFRLAVEQEINITNIYCGIECHDTDYDVSYTTLLWSDFTDKYSAVRVAIVQAVINKLRETK